MICPTLAQQSAIQARGDVLVMAGAGAGKTRTLVERCLDWILEDPANHGLDQILMVTFTEAAAAETRKRLRERLEFLSGSSPCLAEQLALLETAHICTLHSFCLRLVRQHFFALGLDPQSRVLAEDQSRILAAKTLGTILNEHYASQTIDSLVVQDLIQDHGRGWDQPVRALVGRIHAYTQTLPNPEAWFARQFERLTQPEPVLWRQWLMEELGQWRRSWETALQALAADNTKAAECATILVQLPAEPSREEYSAALGQILNADQNWPAKQKTRLRKPLGNLFDEAHFLHSITTVGNTDPLLEDWTWARPQMVALLTVARQFELAFAKAKREVGGLDFHDLEQLTNRLLWSRATGSATELAGHWRSRFKLIFVDEYQDINAAQDAIIGALGGESAAANRFLVGDVKQSIYRFRLANPKIFLGYQDQWQSKEHAHVISLSENFRSHEGILAFVNGLFEALMTKNLGGIVYDDNAKLRFGNPVERQPLALQAGDAPRIELRLLMEPAEPAEETDDDSPELTKPEIEARLIGKRLIELKNSTVQGPTGPRPAKWNDMVILLRSPRGKVEAYVKEFARLGIPIETARGGFYDSLEVSDLLSLLRVLDNPLQDYPLLAVLRSPLAGLSADDLATIRIAQRHGSYWSALVQWHKENKDRIDRISENSAHLSNPTVPLFPITPVTIALLERADLFLTRYYAWRRATRHLALSHCLEMILNQTHYADWLLTQERGEQRRANVERLIQLTRQFDLFQREGLYRFLRFVDGQQDNEIDVEPAATPVGDAVRLMSIHQSKGLEFPIVVVADLAKPFNMDDLTGKVILDEELGLCPQIKPPEARQFYPSLPHWMAQRRQKNETLGEELRLLYVAVTRAVERLMLVGTVRGANLPTRWNAIAASGCAPSELLHARSFLDWIGGWLLHTNQAEELTETGANNLLTWTLHTSNGSAEQCQTAPIQPASDTLDDDMAALQSRLEWRYSSELATRRHAKTSVSLLRREMIDEESELLFDAHTSREFSSSKKSGLSATEKGLAHHAFLEMVALDKILMPSGLHDEAKRLCAEQRLTREEVACLDFEALGAFWESDVGRAFLAHADCVRRELPFTARFNATELGAAFEGLTSEFVVVQGVIDLAAVLPDEIWLLDFKTDAQGGTPEKVHQYRPQLELYARAISRIYGKPVTRSWLHFLSTHKNVAVT